MTSSTRVRRARAGDRQAIHDTLVRCGVFAEDEIEAALRQLTSCLESDERDYHLFVAEEEDESVKGFLSIGPTPRLDHVYDLYWIAVTPSEQGRGIGRLLISFAEDWTRKEGGTTLLIETWGSAAFARTRDFYRQCGYDEDVRVKDFRRLQHDKIIYSKGLN